MGGGGYGFDFHFENCFRVRQKSHIFSSQSNMKCNAKNSGSDYLFYPLSSQIIIIFFFAALGIKIFFFITIPPFSKIVHPVKKTQTKVCLNCNTRRSNSLLLRGYTLISSQKV